MLTPQTTYTEQQLVQQLRLKSREAFDYLYKNYASVLYGVVYRIVMNEETARDVLQEVFVKIWNNIPQYDDAKGRLYTWMINIARNTAIDKTRSKSEILNRKISGDETLVHQGLAGYRTETRIDAIGLGNLIADLKPEHQALIDLAYYKGYTQEEIAKVLGVPLGTVKTRMRQAIKLLRVKFGTA